MVNNYYLEIDDNDIQFLKSLADHYAQAYGRIYTAQDVLRMKEILDNAERVSPDPIEENT